jgi:cell shape-determining protein MreD
VRTVVTFYITGVAFWLGYVLHDWLDDAGSVDVAEVAAALLWPLAFPLASLFRWRDRRKTRWWNAMSMEERGAYLDEHGDPWQ